MKNSRMYCRTFGCNRYFLSEESFNLHLVKDHKIIRFKDLPELKCSHCSKICTNKKRLNEHTYTHTGEKPYKCSVPGCDMVFAYASGLSNHKKDHLSSKIICTENSIISLQLLSKLLSKEEYIRNPNTPEILSLDFPGLPRLIIRESKFKET